MAAPESKPDRRTAAQRRAAQDPNVQLMLRFQQGDRAAFDELIERNLNTVHALVYRFLREPSQIEDITQEVFLRIFRNAHRYKPTAKFSTWMYRIVANLCFNVMRSRKTRRTYAVDFQGGDDDETNWQLPDESAPTPGADLEQTELAGRIGRAISDLPENQRIAIVLYKYEGQNYEEIADVLDLSTMAVKSLLSRARSNLREKLADLDPEKH
jgi:RNA polymerase sigma-70 factor, ECF subfamily